MAAQFIYIDMEKHVSLTNGYNIRSLPTIIAFRDGREVGRVAGANKKQIQSMLESTI
jgi:thioredoxin-like negative regulator of GroEL